MAKILLIGHNHYGYLHSIASGFEALGCEAVVHEHENLAVDKLKRNPIRRWMAARKLKTLNQQVLETVDRVKPNLSLVINGEALLRETIQTIRDVAPFGVWVVDGVDNIRLPREWLTDYDHVFLFEPADVPLVRGATYLAYGVDTSIYHRTGDEHDIDVSFVGAPHENRLPVLETVARHCAENGIDFGIFGPFNRFTKRRHRKAYYQRYPAIAECIRLNRRLQPSEVNDIYNRSKINLNLHHTQSREGVNPRTFEVLAAGGLLLTDWKVQLEQLLDVDNDLVPYRTTEEMCCRIGELLADEQHRERIRESGYKAVVTNHQFGERCARILDVFGLSSDQS